MAEQFYTMCPKCGQIIKAGLKFCPHCGERFVEEAPKALVCPNCGKVAPEGERFCSDCGTAYAPQNSVGSHDADLAEEIPVANGNAPAARVMQTRAHTAEGRGAYDAFYNDVAKPSTKGWAKWLPIMGIFSAVVYLVLAIVMFASYNTLAGVGMLFDCAAVGGLSVMMIRQKKAVYYIALAIYSGIASVMAFIDMDFSGLFWLVVSIYTAVKMYKLERAYHDYTLTGTMPQGKI